MGRKGYLILENGLVFEGESFGYEMEVKGEVVFSTGMTGYPESFTDPSFYGQILTLTYPLVGNYGMPGSNEKNDILSHFESDKIHIRGLLISSYEESKRHYQAEKTLKDYLLENRIPALTGIDTRTLTKILRESGVMKGNITYNKPRKSGLNFYDINKDNLASFVSTKVIKTYGKSDFKVLILDTGMKLNQIRIFLEYGASVIRVPWDYDPFEDPKDIDFDMLFLSNGPGDARTIKKTIATVKKAIDRKIPIAGICLGNQILALASGGDIFKLKYGHRSQNQPVVDEESKKCYITSQNHGYAVNLKYLPKGFSPWFTNLNDGTNEGIRHEKYPFMSVQFHPEAAPGPWDTKWLIKYFIDEAIRWKKS